MYLSLNWLKDFVDIPRSVTPEEIGDTLTMRTVEVEGILKEGEKFEDCLVGKILEIKKHSDADRLQLVRVDVGKKELDIVCGAPNIKKGQLVPVAMIGAELPNGMKIEKAKVRGEVSEGMLAAEDELGLGNDHSGIMILEKAKIGQNLADHLELDDIVLEVDNKSLSNRPDLWGHYGIARELSVFFDSKLKEYKNDSIELLQNKDMEKLDVKVDDFELCPRYMAIAVEGIEIKDSPKWMQKRLTAVGIRPINNIVDITNYVMLETSQPMHAFDKRQVEEIVVRRAKKGETMKTLDDQERKLNINNLVIADKKKAIALAGVMGGANSEIAGDTSSIVLESANFEPVSTRKTANKLGIRTDASSRYEKSLDPNLCEVALLRALELIKELCPKSKVSSDLVDEKKFNLDQGPIDLDLSWVNKIIGKEIDTKEVVKTLEKLGFEIDMKNSEKSVLKVLVPSWRATKDISIPEDIVEEIARIHGYDNIESKMPDVEMEAPLINNERMFERKVKDILSRGAKLAEVYNYSFVGEDQLKRLGMEYSSYIRLANPISVNHTMLRQSLIPNLFENIKLNQAKYNHVDLFEIGNIFIDIPGSVKKDESEEVLPYQEKKLGIVVSSDDNDVFEKCKSILDYLVNILDLSLRFNENESVPDWAVGSSVADVEIQGENLGKIVKMDEKKLRTAGIKKKLAIVEISFRDLFALFSKAEAKAYKELPKYPASVRDLSFVLDSKILYNNIKDEIERSNELVRGVELFDEYMGEKIGRNKKSLAFHIIYRSDKKTLTAEEVDQMQKSLTKSLEKKFDAQIRDF